jgi:hypothetical protein
MDQNRFQLSFNTPIHPRPVRLGDDILSLGSCFAQRVGESLEALRLPITINPFGISFDALTIARQLEYLSGKELPEDYFQHLELWRHFDFHGSRSHVDQQVFLDQIDQSLAAGREAYKKSRFLIITFGTAYFFRHKEKQRNVANCHKLAGNQFERQIAGIQEMHSKLSGAIQQFLTSGNDKEVVLSVSPVRHLSDGLAENNRSKARLIELCHLLTEMDKRVQYFPSYEWLMDVLRDYRFYAEDMTHPSEQAVSLILEEFIKSHFDDSFQSAIEELKKLLSLENHRILHSGTISAKSHAEKTEDLLNKLKIRYPQLNW